MPDLRWFLLLAVLVGAAWLCCGLAHGAGWV